jgi:uncharacterized protein with von Willebrand factor type A (vWA) domain
MADWIRRPFSAPGLTQIPTGPYLRVIQDQYGGTVMLCIDVSGSMHGRPIAEAVRGAQTFVEEAVAAHYRVGVMLWTDRIEALAEPENDGARASRLLSKAKAGGGNNLIGPLEKCDRILGKFTGDRVVALFGDGDLTPKSRVLKKVAEMKADNIRFITRGLGRAAAREFGEISSEEPSAATVSGVDDLAAGIAGMAKGLKGKKPRS